MDKKRIILAFSAEIQKQAFDINIHFVGKDVGWASYEKRLLNELKYLCDELIDVIE